MVPRLSAVGISVVSQKLLWLPIGCTRSWTFDSICKPVIARRGWTAGFLEWSQRPGRRFPLLKSMLTSGWLRLTFKLWGIARRGIGLLGQDMLWVNEYLSDSNQIVTYNRDMRTEELDRCSFAQWVHLLMRLNPKHLQLWRSRILTIELIRSKIIPEVYNLISRRFFKYR